MFKVGRFTFYNIEILACEGCTSEPEGLCERITRAVTGVLPHFCRVGAGRTHTKTNRDKYLAKGGLNDTFARHSFKK